VKAKNDVSIGARIGRLTVVGEVRSPGSWVYQKVECRCDCGNVKSIARKSLRQGLTASCGCLQRELASSRGLKHGSHANREYSCWIGMRERCLNPKHHAWKYYGGAGIKVCAEWAGSFEAFLRDVGPRPSMRHTLDRIDGTKGYGPGNIRWATRREQALNRRTTRMVTIGSETKCVTDWARTIGVCHKKLGARVRAGVPADLLFPESRFACGL
jgi:hypothetical protein